MLRRLSGSMVPPNLHGPLLVNDLGVPRYWATVWSTMSASLFAETTHVKKLRHIENLYRHADTLLRRPDSLDDALAARDGQTLARILESWFVSIRNQSTVTAEDEKRWHTGFTFTNQMVTWLARCQETDNATRGIAERLHRLSLLYGQLSVRKDNPVEMLRSLPATVVEELYALLDPESEQNPSRRRRTRWRVFVAFVLMLHQGLRRGELLLLTADVVKSAYDRKQGRTRYWLNVQQSPYEDEGADSRYSRPHIKTAHSIRQIPMSEFTARVVQTYVENYRGRPQHSFLLNSQENSPLSTETLTKVFSRASSALSTTALTELKNRTGKTSVTPHDLRHTCAVVRLQQLLTQGDSMDEALQKMRTFFGWSRKSDMPSRYARAVFEDRLAAVWNDAFDDRIEILRALPNEI